MTAEREAFLQRVRQAVVEGNRAGRVPDLPSRGHVGYQGAGADPLSRFCRELAAAGGQAHVVAEPAAALARTLELVAGRRTLYCGGPVVEPLKLPEHLRAAGVEVVRTQDLTPANCRGPFFAAEVGVTGVDYLIAETGSLVLLAGSHVPRSVSLLPPVHVAVASRAQIIPDLFDLFETVPWANPSSLVLITGPSKTGDIELKLVTGVHGPGELHVILLS